MVTVIGTSVSSPWHALNLRRWESNTRNFRLFTHSLMVWSSWVSFTQITNMYVGEWVRSEARKNPEDREVENALWENLVSRLTQECLHLATIASRSNSKRKNGPGSEYTGYSSNI